MMNFDDLLKSIVDWKSLAGNNPSEANSAVDPAYSAELKNSINNEQMVNAGNTAGVIIPPANQNEPSKNPYEAYSNSLAGLKQAQTDELNNRLARFEEYRNNLDKLRKDNETPIGDFIFDLGTALAKGYGTMQMKTTPGMIKNGITPINPASGVDGFIKDRAEWKEGKNKKIQAQIQQMREYMDLVNGVGADKAKLGEYDLKNAEMGISKAQRDEDVALRRQQIAQSAGQHSDNIKLQREKMAQELAMAGMKTRADTLKQLQEVSGKYGEKSAENMASTLDKMEGDQIYKDANKMYNAANTVRSLLKTEGGFAEIGALIQALRALGDTGVISDSDMKRNIAGSLSAIESWLAPIISSGAGGLTAEQKQNIDNTMASLLSNVKGTIDERRATYRDSYSRSEQLRYDNAKKTYGELPGMGMPKQDELDKIFNIGRFNEPANRETKTEEKTQNFGEMSTGNLINSYKSATGDQKRIIAQEMLRRGINP